jgi:hypothetical protein
LLLGNSTNGPVLEKHCTTEGYYDNLVKRVVAKGDMMLLEIVTDDDDDHFSQADIKYYSIAGNDRKGNKYFCLRVL